MDDTCITISGRPDALADFSESLAVSSVVHKTTLDTLYHAPIHLQGAREQVLADVSRRGIVFPDFGDVKVPLRSTFTGEALTKETTAGTLVELIVDMLLTQPVNWDLVVMEVVKAVPEDIPVRLVNVGPGMGLSRSLERALPRTQVGTMDISTSIAEHSPQTMGIKQEPIAIVGMAVNMPGAPSNTMLWDVLEKGINTISEVSCFCFDLVFAFLIEFNADPGASLQGVRLHRREESKPAVESPYWELHRGRRRI